MHNTSEKSVAVLQGNVQKCSTRQLIAEQVVEWADKCDVKEINMAGLSAHEWRCEEAIMTRFSTEKNVPVMNFYSAEKNRKVFMGAMSKRPLNGYLCNSSFEDMMKGHVRWESRVGYYTKNTNPVTINLMWADYCHNAVLNDIKHFASMTAKMPNNSLALITFGLKDRQKGNKGLAKMFAGVTNGSTDPYKAVKGATTYYIKKANRNRKVQLVFDVVYGGGGNGGSTMLVLGYALGVKQKITPIVRNLREGKTEARAKNQGILNRIKKGDIRFTRKGLVSTRYQDGNTPSYQGKLPIDVRNAIAKMILKGEETEDIAEQYDVSTHTVGAIRSHVEHPASFRN